eukprot:gnl/Dysnectes_brevis/242_a273_2808.p2 GENE.gnl/Dysnectes_brevis/242_a273_2808~~gnl/Dysnectes_brevis/242_a273_2808.p2  ORF type:complete len:401 (+),score=130.18 gnl/Dysnectes_brevis/242_a273_2808:1738-2940(+)
MLSSTIKLAKGLRSLTSAHSYQFSEQLKTILSKQPEDISLADTKFLLSDKADLTDDAKLFETALEKTESIFGPDVYLRAIIEFSNICQLDCNYCGIRGSQKDVERFMLTREQILSAADHALDLDYPGLLLQSGEIRSQKRVDWLADVLADIQDLALARGRALRVILSVGELSLEQYQQLKAAGAHRYLLRIETTDPELWGIAHPPAQTLDSRKAALEALDEAGYHVGSGLLVGLPGQTPDHLAADVIWLRDHEIDMLGCGPYIPAPGTPLAEVIQDRPHQLGDSLMTTVRRLVSTLRICMPDANISATTAMEVLHPSGRTLALQSGANVVMPVLTPPEARSSYSLYKGKSGVVSAEEQLAVEIRAAGKEPRKDIPGDPPRWRKKQMRRGVPVENAFSCPC